MWPSGLSITGPAADARPRVKLKTQHYRVDGSDAAAIVSSMMKQHRLLGGQGRVGRTKMKRRIEWSFSETRKSCRVKSHTVRLDFTTQLPLHKSEKRLRGSLRKHWRAFAKHVKWHEGQHRKIWLSCARKTEKTGQPDPCRNLRAVAEETGTYLQGVQRSLRQAPRQV